MCCLPTKKAQLLFFFEFDAQKALGLLELAVLGEVVVQDEARKLCTMNSRWKLGNERG